MARVRVTLLSSAHRYGWDSRSAATTCPAVRVRARVRVRVGAGVGIRVRVRVRVRDHLPRGRAASAHAERAEGGEAPG